MLRQNELAYIKALSTFQISPDLLKELRNRARRNKNPAVPVGKRSITTGSGARSSQQLVGNHKDNELATSGD